MLFKHIEKYLKNIFINKRIENPFIFVYYVYTDNKDIIGFFCE